MGYPFNSLRPGDNICISRLTTIGLDNGLSPGRRQSIIWTNAGILLIRPLGTNFGEFFIQNYNIFIHENTFEIVVCEMAAILSRLSLNVLNTNAEKTGP